MEHEKFSMELRKLRNGTQERQGLVNLTFCVLKELWNNQRGLFYDFVLTCRNREHYLTLEGRKILKGFEMIDAHGEMKRFAINTVLSATEGEFPQITLHESPYADE
jgi:hypothetical protein